MKIKSSTKKLIVTSLLVLFAVTLSGCRIPTNADGTIKLITADTTFAETMSNENWFNAILVYPMAQFMNKYAGTLTVGGAIAILTIVVNLILLLFTMKSTIATQQMQLLQPELNKIQRKYEGKTDENSRMRQAQEMQALYNKYNINPMSMILTQFIQFPIIIAMYHAVQRSVAVKTGSFAGLALEMKPLDGIRGGQYGYIVLFVLMGLTQFAVMKVPQMLAKKKAMAEAEKAHRRYVAPEENKQTKYMQLYMGGMILIFGLMWPAAMALYWTISNIVNIGKTFLVQKIISGQTQKETK